MTIQNAGCGRTLKHFTLIASVAMALPAAPVMGRPKSLKRSLTARKAQVNLQEAPRRGDGRHGRGLRPLDLVKLDNFNGYVPGLTTSKNDGAGRVVAVRGVGWETAQNLSTQPNVLIYMDGIYVANPLAMGTDLGELDGSRCSAARRARNSARAPLRRRHQPR